MRMQWTSNVGEHNVDVPSSTIVAGPFASNNLKIDPSFAGTDVDEMALPYVLSQWSQICTGRLTTSQAVNSTLYGAYVSPSAMWYREPTAAPYGNIPPYKFGVSNATTGTNAFIPSSVFFWSQLFKEWRGGFEFRFTFAKTKLHGGRLMAAFIPRRTAVELTSVAPTTTWPTINGPENDGTNVQPFAYSAIFDLRDGNTFTFDVPFVSDLPYLRFWDFLGSLTLTVIDPLQVTGTVANYVDFMVEVRAKPDYELAIPCGPAYPTHPGGHIRLQSGKMLSTINDNASQMAIGESVTSVKQLIMLPKLTEVSAPVGTTSALVMPWYYQPVPTADRVAQTVPREAYGYGGIAASAYLYARGGTDVHLTPLATNNIYMSVSQCPVDKNNVVTGIGSDPWNRSAVALPRVDNNSSAVHARFPGY
jgi:hypothetical protein